jgi:hypothetical protein
MKRAQKGFSFRNQWIVDEQPMVKSDMARMIRKVPDETKGQSSG